MKSTTTSLAAALLLAAAPAWGAFALLEALPGDTASQGADISDDGQVVGRSLIPGQALTSIPLSESAVRWTSGTSPSSLGTLPGGSRSSASAVSADGQVIAGASTVAGSTAPFRWTEQAGMAPLALTSGYGAGAATRVSIDGSHVIGFQFRGSPFSLVAALWSEGQLPVLLGTLLPEDSQTFAADLVPDASVIVGYSGGGGTEFQAFRYTSSQGMVGLGFLPGGEVSLAFGISADGAVVVGRGSSASWAAEAFRWTEAEGMVGLGVLPGYTGSAAFSVSADGTVVAGCVYEEYDPQVPVCSEAIIWSAGAGLERLSDRLALNGVEVPAGWTLETARLSRNGAWVTGTAVDTGGLRRAYRSPLGPIAPPVPAANDDVATTLVDTPVVIDVLANDSALTGPLVVTISAPPAAGMAEVEGSPGLRGDIAVTYTPAAGFSGEDLFTYTVEGEFGSVSALVRVSVLAPGANPDQAFTQPGEALLIDVLGNDIGFGDLVRLEILLAPDAGGSAEVVDLDGAPVADGIGSPAELRVRYVPNVAPGGGLPLAERFTYQVTGPLAPPVVGTEVFRLTNVTLAVPFGTADSDLSDEVVITDAGETTIVGGVVNVSGIGWQSLAANSAYTYGGPDTQWQAALDGGVVSKLAEQCTQDPANLSDACGGPRGLLGDWIDGQLQDGTPSDDSSVSVSRFGNVLTIFRQTELYQCPGGLAVVCNTPGLNYLRVNLSFTLDGPGGALPGGANDDIAVLIGDAPVEIDVLANDSGFGQQVSVSLFSIPAWGTAQVTGSPGSPAGIRVVYSPGPGFTSEDSFQYIVEGGGNIGIATVKVFRQRQDTAEVTVTVVERAAADDFASTGPGEPVVIDVLGNDSGLLEPVSIGLLAGPGHGIVEVLNSPGPAAAVRLRYVPAAGFRGIDSFVYRVTDAFGSQSATVTVGVGLAGDVLAETGQGQPVLIDVLPAALGFGEPVTLSIGTPPGNGSVTVLQTAGGPQLAYTPAPGFPPANTLRASDLFTYLLDDGVFSGEGVVEVEVFLDADGDGVPDDIDNCLGVFNPDQRDTSGSGFGNRCDADLNGDGIVNFADLAIFLSRFGTSDPDADLNGDGIVNFADLAIFQSLFGRPPGPSALVD